MLFEMVLLVALVPPTQPPALPDIPLALVALFPPDRFLVKGHALAARAFERGRVTATPFELDHVYVGPGVLGANTFTADLYKYQIGFSISKSGMPVEKGEPVMCWIEKTKGILTTPEVPLMPGFDLMVFAPTLREGPKEGPMARRVPENRGSDAAYDNFERGVAQYELAVTKAEVFEKIYRASEKDRLKVIDGFVRSGDSAKGAAALMLLLRGNYPREVDPAKNDLRERYTIDKHPKIAEYVLPFAKDDSLSPRVQWEVELLLRLNKERWEGSADEWKMVKRWFAGDWKEKAGVPWEVSEERFLLEDTSKTSIFRGGMFPLPGLMELGVAGLANPARSDRFKTELLRALLGTAKGTRNFAPKEAEEGFAELVKTIGKGAPSERIAAAKLLVAFLPYSAQQRQTIESLRRQKLGDAVTKELEKALAEK